MYEHLLTKLHPFIKLHPLTKTILTKLYLLRQAAQWVHEYLQAPVSLREIVEDTGAGQPTLTLTPDPNP